MSNTMAQTRLLTSDAFAHPLDPAADDGGAFVPLGALRDVEVGIWESSAPESSDIEADEVLLILKGEGHVDFEDGSVIHLLPGVVVRLRAGDRTVWRVISPIRKLYVG